MEYLHADHDEWFDMWAELADNPMNLGDAQCSFMGATWEYMGSTSDHHHFRHSKHPASGEVEYLYIERRRKVLGWV
ncbi:4-diphosphocytidyl-2C-methyl-D-erythritol kinase [Agaribacterium sp. ZY112]|uniref:4-diphosphocytidyl-2C-methyl-D-erythritol kinase n=1 Tax=Agaribacterium sp. ZY112 TaxID=3233574 RepID=UPI00352632F4